MVIVVFINVVFLLRSYYVKSISNILLTHMIKRFRKTVKMVIVEMIKDFI